MRKRQCSARRILEMPQPVVDIEDDDDSNEGLDEWAFVRKAVKKADELEDNRAEFSTVDYTPCTNIRPVDLTVKVGAAKAWGAANWRHISRKG